MEAKTEQKKLIVLKAPQGEINVYASYGLMTWGVDNNGKKFVKWGENEWMPADPTENEDEKEEEKKMEEK